jgi:hypothetical protein
MPSHRPKTTEPGIDCDHRNILFSFGSIDRNQPPTVSHAMKIHLYMQHIHGQITYDACAQYDRHLLTEIWLSRSGGRG